MTTLNETEARELRRCLGQFGTGVTVVTAQNGADRVGVTANSFSSLSLDPPLILWSIKRTSRSFHAFQAAEHFAVNILSTDQIAVSQAFSGPETDKFSGVTCASGKAGSPIIPGAIAVIECKVEARHDGGDHVIMVGHVLHFARSPGDALLFSQGRYAVAIDHPKLTRIDLAPQVDDGPDEAEPSFWTLMFLAQHRMSRRFDRHREEEGFNAEQTRVLIDVFDRPGCTVEQLVGKSFLPRIVAEDAIAVLAERGFIERDNGCLHLTEAGNTRRRAIAVRWKSFEEEELTGIREDDLKRARSVLTAILSH